MIHDLDEYKTDILGRLEHIKEGIEGLAEFPLFTPDPQCALGVTASPEVIIRRSGNSDGELTVLLAIAANAESVKGNKEAKQLGLIPDICPTAHEGFVFNKYIHTVINLINDDLKTVNEEIAQYNILIHPLAQALAAPCPPSAKPLSAAAFSTSLAPVAAAIRT